MKKIIILMSLFVINNVSTRNDQECFNFVLDSIKQLKTQKQDCTPCTLIPLIKKEADDNEDMKNFITSLRFFDYVKQSSYNPDFLIQILSAISIQYHTDFKECQQDFHYSGLVQYIKFGLDRNELRAFIRIKENGIFTEKEKIIAESVFSKIDDYCGSTCTKHLKAWTFLEAYGKRDILMELTSAMKQADLR